MASATPSATPVRTGERLKTHVEAANKAAGPNARAGSYDSPLASKRNHRIAKTTNPSSHPAAMSHAALPPPKPA